MGSDQSEPTATASRPGGVGRESVQPELAIPQLVLAALSVTALITTQLTAAKVIAVGLPDTFPLTGDLITVPAAVFAHAVTVFASDCYRRGLSVPGCPAEDGTRTDRRSISLQHIRGGVPFLKE